MIEIDGVEVYPEPKLVISIPIISPAVLIIGFPASPLPPPPEKDIDGAPHGNCDVLQPPPPTSPKPSDIFFNVSPRKSDTAAASLSPVHQFHLSTN